MKKISQLKIATCVAALCLQGSYAMVQKTEAHADSQVSPQEEQSYANRDPWETFNRPMFYFNDWIDRWFLKPVANLYNTIFPKPLTKGISNMYNNIDTVPTIINDVLQGNLYQAVSDAWRLGINTSIGILGFFDVATELGLEPNKEDFGLTLAHWGWANSNYLVLPFLGPGTVRDQVAWPINYEYMTIYPYIHSDAWRYGIYMGGIVVRRAELLRYQNVLDEAALDRYTFIRDAYFQRRNYQIERNKELGNPYLEQSSTATEPPPVPVIIE